MAGLLMRRRPAIVSLAVVALPLAAMPWHVGSTSVYLLSVAVWAAFAGLAVPRPRSVFYTAVVVMWSLGFPLKLALHLLVDYPYREPIGDFAGTPDAWDAVLAVVTCGMAGAAVARLISLRWPYISPADNAPSWYVRAPAVIWSLTGMGLLTAAVVNWRLSLYQIGVHPVATLPWRGHLLVSWVVALGGGLLVAALVDWERGRLRKMTTAGSLRLTAAIGAEAIVASTSALSRGIILFRMVPYWVSYAHGVRGTLLGTPKAALHFALVGVVAMVLTLGLVSMERARRFTAATHEALAAAARQAGTPVSAPPSKRVIIATQFRNLLVDRWVGLEGVMAVTSAPVRPSVMEVLREPASAGVDAWFQRLSHAPYMRLEGFTFQALPGPLALCATTDSLPLVAGVTMALALLLLGMERGIQRMWRAPHLSAMAGVAMANYFVQMNVPYLWMVFLVQLMASVTALVLVRDAGARKTR